MVTHDEVGLGSPLVIDYHRRYPERWWIRFLEEQRPTYLVQRAHMLDDLTHHGYELSADEAAWFDRTYELIRHFRYDPADYVSSPALLELARLGDHDDYLVYRMTSE